MAWLPSWEAFLKVAEHGSMAAAARRLDCSRAQVSKQIGELERQLGARLFERSTRRLRLTPAGEIFRQHARHALDAVAGSELAVRQVDAAPRGLLRVSATQVFGRRYVAPLLAQLATQHPGLDCELLLGDRVVDLAEERVDVALRITRSPPDDAVARPLARIERVLCAAPAYLAACGEPATPAELPAHQCFRYLIADANDWLLRDEAGRERRVPVHARLQCNDLDCLYEATLAGQGIAILPTFLCGDALAAGGLRRVLGDHTPVLPFGDQLYACYAPSRARMPKVQVLLDALSALLQPRPPWEHWRAAPSDTVPTRMRKRP